MMNLEASDDELDEIEAKVVVATADHEDGAVFASLLSLVTKMIIVASDGDATEVSRVFRNSADRWDDIFRGAHH